MRKTVRDKLLSKGAQLTVLITDTCNVPAPATPVYKTVTKGIGKNWVMSNLFLEHSGVFDVSGSSKNQYGWFSLDVGGWFSSS